MNTPTQSTIWPRAAAAAVALVGMVVAPACSSQSKTRSKTNGAGDEPPMELTSEDDVAAPDDRDDSANLLRPPKKPRVPERVQKYRGGTLRRAVVTGPKGFNFLVENSLNVREIQRYVLGFFARRDLRDPKRWVPGLAEKITHNGDYTEFTIHLREGLYWQKPNVDRTKEKYAWLDERRELTAEDCVFAFEMVTNEDVDAGAAKNYFRKLEKAVRVDRYTCRVIWKERTAQAIPQTLGWYPLPKWLYTRTETGEKIPKNKRGVRFNRHWASDYAVGVGPYRVESYEPGEHLTLERDEDFYGRTPPIETIRYEIVENWQKRLRRLQSGTLDFAKISPRQYRRHIANGGAKSAFEKGDLDYEIVDKFAYYYIGWNSEKPLFRQVKVRRALTHALNRSGIIANQLHGLAEIQTGPFHHEHEANDPEIEPYEYSLEKARELLSDAGWSDDDGDGVRETKIDGRLRELEFSMLVYNRRSFLEAVSVYKDDLRKIGVVLHPKPVDWPTMQEKMNEKRFDAFTGGWGLSWYVDPYQIWHSSQAEVPRGSNRVGFDNERADRIIEALRETFDREERRELLREFHRIVHRKQPYTFFYAPKEVYAWNSRLKNVQFQKMRPQDLSWPWYLRPDRRNAEN